MLILATHRLIGGLSDFDIDTFRDVVRGDFEVEATDLAESELEQFTRGLDAKEAHTFGLFDGKQPAVSAAIEESGCVEEI